MGHAQPNTFTRRIRVSAAISILALGLAACSGETPLASTTTALATTSTTSPATTSTTAPATTTTEAPATTTTVAPTTTTAQAAAATLAVAPDGLSLVDSSGSTTQLPFGTAQDEVVASVDAALGEAGVVSPGNVECPNDQAAFAKWSDLQLEFSPEGLIAWRVDPGSTTTDVMGLGVGSTVSDITAGWGVTVFESTLGTEFYSGADGEGIAGLLSDDSDSAVVVTYWAGFVCTFR